jgi:predicted small secreted protein
MRFIVLSVLAVLAFSSAGCRQEGAAERAGRELDEAVEDAGEAVEDAGEAVEDAAEDAKEKARKALE